MTTPSLRTTAVRRAAALTLAASALTLAGCSATNAVTTTKAYAASDGVDATLGSLSFGNLLVLSAAKGDPGTVLGSVTNAATSKATVTIGIAGDTATLSVPAGATVLLGPDHTAVPLSSVSEPPGALITLDLASDADGSTSLQVPVLDGTFAQYATLVPTP